MKNKMSFSQGFSLGLLSFKISLGYQALFSLVFWIGMLIVAVMGGAVGAIIPYSSNIVTGLLGTPLTLGFLLLANQAYLGKTIEFGNAFDGYRKMIPLFVVNFIQQLVMVAILVGLGYLMMKEPLMDMYALMMDMQQVAATDPAAVLDYYRAFGDIMIENLTSVSFIFLVAMIASLFFLFTPFYILLKNQSIGEALQNGAKLASDNFFTIILFGIVMVLIMTAALLIPFINIIIMIFFMMPFAYSMLLGLFRSAEREDVETVSDGNDDILDLN